jgi:hypothetical protein
VDGAGLPDPLLNEKGERGKEKREKAVDNCAIATMKPIGAIIVFVKA